MDISKDKLAQIEAELAELAPGEHVKVKLDKRMEVGSSIRMYDDGKHGGYLVRLNPKRIRNENKLEAHIGFCRNTIAY